MLKNRPTMFDPHTMLTFGSRLRRILLSIFLLVCALPASAQELSGVWLSPDWLFPGERRYGEDEVRRGAAEALESLAQNGIDTVFLETFLRGYAICPSLESSPDGLSYALRPYGTALDAHPVYRHLDWPYRQEYGIVHDPLQIFIEEGLKVGVEVHAWVHLFYWRMDNSDVMLNWHDGPTVWGGLMAGYLTEQAERFRQHPSEIDRAVTPELLERAAAIFGEGLEVPALESLLVQAGIAPNGRPIGVLLSRILKAGGERPSFLLIANDDDPFPAPRGKRLRPIYVNPEDPQVRSILVEVCRNIVVHHPGLGGLHLDHVRYPVDGQGLGEVATVVDGSYRYFSASDPNQLREYRALQTKLEERKEALRSLVVEIREALPRRFPLSAAVLPLYYRDRDLDRFRTSGNDYSGQAWLDWPVDFVVPMMYEYHPYLIRTLVRSYRAQARAQTQEGRPIRVYPGISRILYTRNGGVDSADGWVFFDLSFARDIQFRRQSTEDLDFD